MAAVLVLVLLLPPYAARPCGHMGGHAGARPFRVLPSRKARGAAHRLYALPHLPPCSFEVPGRVMCVCLCSVVMAGQGFKPRRGRAKAAGVWPSGYFQWCFLCGSACHAVP